jgi:hypothetical protein
MGALALIDLLDRDADIDARYEGALLVIGLLESIRDDLRMLRTAYTKER